MRHELHLPVDNQVRFAAIAGRDICEPGEEKHGNSTTEIVSGMIARN
jgi:hypothetical protein